MPEFHDRRTGQVTEHNPVRAARETNSAGGSKWQLPAHDEAKRLNNSWMAGPAHRYAYNAVVWHQDGKRSEGTWVTPHERDGQRGIMLHQLNTGGTFHPENTVSEVHLVERKGVPSSAEREDQHREQMRANEPSWRM